VSSPYIGEIRMFAGNFPPVGWAFCNGQTLAISENDALFNLIGTTYGGDGQETFNLPDLQGRFPIHQGTSTTGTTFTIGGNGGVEDVTISVNQLPIHSHPLLASLNNAGASSVTGNVTGQVGATQIYREVAPAAVMSANSLVPAGGSQPHTNIQPYLTINYIISLFGVFPTQN
jgi:microcystin-dependent protein